MERMNWATRRTISKTTAHRIDAPTYVPKPIEPLGVIIGDHATHKAKEEMEQELWSTRGDRQTMGEFIVEIKTQEGLTEPK